MASISRCVEDLLGIEDQELALSLYEMGSRMANPSDFALAVDQELGFLLFPPLRVLIIFCLSLSPEIHSIYLVVFHLQASLGFQMNSFSTVGDRFRMAKRAEFLLICHPVPLQLLDSPLHCEPISRSSVIFNINALSQLSSNLHAFSFPSLE